MFHVMLCSEEVPLVHYLCAEQRELWKVGRVCSGKGPQGGSCEEWIRYKLYSQIIFKSHVNHL